MKKLIFNIFPLFISCMILTAPLLVSSCTVLQRGSSVPENSYYGIWLLNREKTLGRMMKKRGVEFTELSTEEQSRMIKSFPFDLIVEFDRNNSWRGSFQDDDGTINNGKGNYTVSKKGLNSYWISVEEKSGEGSFADKFEVKIVSEKEILIILGSKDSIDLILNSTGVFRPINKRPEMVSPEGSDI